MTVIRRLTLANGTIEYKIVRSNRRKTSELFVDAESVLIRTPAQKSTKEIDRIIKIKAGWIAKKQEQYRQSKSVIMNPTFEEGSLLPYLGKAYPLSIVDDYKFREEKIRFTNGEFLVTLKNSRKTRKRQIQKLYKTWLLQRAQAILNEKALKFGDLLGVTPRMIRIKDMKMRWGSATKSGVLSFNLNLLKAPEDVVEYVVLHEICHLKIRDHSQRFWKMLKIAMPDYEEKAEWLSSNGHGLV